MNNRDFFEVVEVEIVAFDVEDIIRTSPTGEEGIIPGNPVGNPTNMFGEYVRPST